MKPQSVVLYNLNFLGNLFQFGPHYPESPYPEWSENQNAK